MVTNDSLRSYFDKARRFDQDRLIQWSARARSPGRLPSAPACWRGSIFSVAGLTPLKTVEPFVIRVDNSTGIVDVVIGAVDRLGTYDEAVTKFFAASYVRAREGYVGSEAEDNFRTVALMSTPAEQTRFAAFIAAAIRRAPRTCYGRGRRRADQYHVDLTDQSQGRPVRLHARHPRRRVKTDPLGRDADLCLCQRADVVDDRLINPLGFLVSDYRADPEVAPMNSHSFSSPCC